MTPVLKYAVKQCIILCTGLKYIGREFDNKELIWIGSYGQTYFAITFILGLIDPHHHFLLPAKTPNLTHATYNWMSVPDTPTYKALL